MSQSPSTVLGFKQLKLAYKTTPSGPLSTVNIKRASDRSFFHKERLWLWFSQSILAKGLSLNPSFFPPLPTALRCGLAQSVPKGRQTLSFSATNGGSHGCGLYTVSTKRALDPKFSHTHTKEKEEKKGLLVQVFHHQRRLLVVVGPGLVVGCGCGCGCVVVVVVVFTQSAPKKEKKKKTKNVLRPDDIDKSRSPLPLPPPSLLPPQQVTGPCSPAAC